MGVQVEPVTPPVGLGEGPHWSTREQALYYVDVFAQNVHRFHPETGNHSTLHIEGGPVTLVVPHAHTPNTYVISVGRDLALVTWPDPAKDAIVTSPTAIIASVDPEHKDNRFNDGKCDPLGRLWAGDDGRVTRCLDKVSISNGLAWSEDGRTLYYVDTCEYKLEAFTCDLETGKIGDRRTIYDYRAGGLYPAFPDGLTIDTQGRLWVACFGAAKVHCINPRSGQVEDSVTLPTDHVTSVTFGGRDLDQLFVTTTTKWLTPAQLLAQPSAGAVFRVTGLKAKGRPNMDCKIRIN
ncbi:Regucalcin [Chionoecetes opilio]|uniref:Regucalcin n=1 Tax=Chionoecetes opilio TaxID=41210 RepID=A0A8J5CTX0_CHIOP|nr:Regucalcin [Chionoecetes opilio]